MLLVPLLMLLADDDALIAAARERTRAEVPCTTTHRSDEILVCGRREADRYRVSFVTTGIRDSVPTERSRLLEPKANPCGRVGASFAGCGFVGVTASTNGQSTQVKPRELAP
ncbi:hypothetical protein LZK98_00075 [Sphingomonas cannabina]|uniref:hypothetical protein n=1 Tax=Sphingomonas cannabina TaxID=2899123 RepID=UPI001F30A507|nr:hypothetical protein [Sphingomonas cannabina]UIJ45402.1 hypothetical protein LZK98_00075 [Sphingomonas cannabina]